MNGRSANLQRPADYFFGSETNKNLEYCVIANFSPIDPREQQRQHEKKKIENRTRNDIDKFPFRRSKSGEATSKSKK